MDFRRLKLEQVSQGVLELELYNPNRFRLAAESLRYFLVCGEDTLAQGVKPQGVSMAALDSIVAEFPFELRYDIWALVLRLPAILADTVWLQLEGRYVVSWPGGSGRFSYARYIFLAEELNRLRNLFGGD